MKFATLLLATVFCLGSLNAQTSGPQANNPVVEMYCIEAYVHYEDPNGNMSPGQWTASPYACSDKSGLLRLFSNMRFSNAFLPNRLTGAKRKTFVHTTKLRIVRKEIYLDGSVTITVIPNP